jgi:hypothetical protein
MQPDSICNVGSIAQQAPAHASCHFVFEHQLQCIHSCCCRCLLLLPPFHLPAAFYQLKTPVEKSDAWRYHVLCGHGGIYTDTDTVCGRPFSEWTNFNSTPEPGLIVGIENRFYTQEVQSKKQPISTHSKGSSSSRASS